jgi:DNA-binding NtrC family response regulator
MPANILSVFSRPEERALVERAIGDEHAVVTAESAAAALEVLSRRGCAAAIVDETLEDASGEELASRLRAVAPSLRVVIAASAQAVDHAIDVLGPCEFVYATKPLSAARVRHAVALELERASLVAENWRLRARLERVDPTGVLVGLSAAAANLRERIRFAAASDAPVLVGGEEGTGKVLAAEAIHRSSERAGGPMRRVDCEVTPDELLAGELFGFERSGGRREPGKLELCRGGTLVVAEVGEMSPEIQAEFAAALARAGDDVRVIATTSVDLRERVRDGAFDESLYYTINTLSVEMPALRERRADIPALAVHFARLGAARGGMPAAELTSSAIERLTRYEWRTNLRELQEVVEQAVLGAGGGSVDADDLRMTRSGAGRGYTDEVERVFRTGSVRAMEKLMILNRLRENDQNRTRSAESLEISVRTLRNKLNEYNVGRKQTETLAV